ncbi:MAG: hypothetical protein K6E36_08740 [Oscillospiraceae bacterium]|nr:hypothetical protein [Oscillospiraceae bacterium]
MLGSDYRELIVPRLDDSWKAPAVLTAGIALTVLVTAFSLLTGKFLLLLLAAAVAFGTWYLWTTQRVEYEYIISGDELEITKILAESRRKPMFTTSLKDFTAFGRLTEMPAPSPSQTVVLACSSQDETAFCADLEHSQYGQTRLIFTPNDDILYYLSLHMPRNLNFRWEKPAEDEEI